MIFFDSTRKTFILLLSTLALALGGCHKVDDKIEPTVSYAVQDRYLLSLPSPFEPLTEEEKAQDYGKEMLIGFGFAHELDLYQAITAFKRAEFLVPSDQKMRSLEIQYEILLCYYMGKKWRDVIYSFEHSDLRYINQDFPAYHDLLLILYESYEQAGMENKADQFLQAIYNNDPVEGQNLLLSHALIKGDISSMEQIAAAPPERVYLDNFLYDYSDRKKSVSTAQTLNAFIPGAGYLYLGQKQSATTAFFLNSLFIAASTFFFLDGNIAAGIIFTSFEAGWYFGGIYGAGLEAKEYNERLYESMATPMMNRERLFPALMLNYAF